MTTIDRIEQVARAMTAAWGRIKKARNRAWGEWMTIGEGLMEGRRWAMQKAGTNKPEGKGYAAAYGEWLARYRVDDMDKSDRAKLLQLMEERPAVEAWRGSLGTEERLNLNNPTSVWRRWHATTRVTKPKSRAAALSAGESSRARGLIEEYQERIAELEQERDAARHDEGSLFDLKKDSPTSIATAVVGNVSETKAKAIMAEMKKLLAKQTVPAG
jgi:hypothetical protein